MSFDAATRTFIGNPTGAGATTVRVTASDGSLTAYDDFVITAVAAPELKATQNLDGVSNLDVRSKLVLDFTQDITLGNGQIRIQDNEGASGWLLSNQGETRQDTTDNDVVITLTNGAVTNLTVGGVGWQTLGTNGINQTRLANSVRVSGSKLIIDIGGTDATTYAASNTDWTFDWDFATDYHVEFDAGIVSAAGQVNVAMTDPTRVNFTTVTPVGNNTGAASQTMGDDGSVTAGTTWHSAHVGSSTGTATSMGFGTGSHALYMVGYGNPDGTGKLATSMTGHVDITGFGADDLLYIDNMGLMSAVTSNGLKGAGWTGSAGTTKRAMGNGDSGDPLWVTFSDYTTPTITSISSGGGFDHTFETKFLSNVVIFG